VSISPIQGYYWERIDPFTITYIIDIYKIVFEQYITLDKICYFTTIMLPAQNLLRRPENDLNSPE